MIEERQGNFSAFEMKFNPKQKGLIPQTFLDNYKISETAIVNRDNLSPERFREERIRLANASYFGFIIICKPLDM